jgi:hypothetical protein
MGLRTMGTVLVVWGLVLEVLGAATWLGFGPAENGFGPTRSSRLQIFSSAGIVLAVAGAWMGLTSVPRALRRRMIARAIEAVSIGGAVGVLILGILFHDTKRDPWIVGIVALACVASWAARQWSRPRGSQADRVAS